MRTTPFSFLRISLDQGECFLASSPRGGRQLLVHRIDVWDDSFFLAGDDSRRHNKPHLRNQISWGFRSTSEVPMPLSVAQEVERCMAQLQGSRAAA